MRLSLLLLFCSLCGSLFPLRADTPAPDLNDLAAWAADRLDDGVSFEPETLWGDLSLLRVLRDTVTIGLVYESLDRSGCTSCSRLDFRIAVCDGRVVTIELSHRTAEASGGNWSEEAIRIEAAIVGELLSSVIESGLVDSLSAKAGSSLPSLSERLQDVAFLHSSVCGERRDPE